MLATASGAMVAVWDPSPNIPVQLLPRWTVAQSGVVRCVRWNHTNQVVGVSGDGALLVRARTMRLAHACGSPRSPSHTLARPRFARTSAGASERGRRAAQSLHHHASGTCVGSIPDPAAPTAPPTPPLAVEPSTLSSIAFSKGSRYLATAGPPCKEVLIWDLKRKVIHSFVPFPRPCVVAAAHTRAPQSCAQAPAAVAPSTSPWVAMLAVVTHGGCAGLRRVRSARCV
jgi:hypothetical protein